MNEYNYDFSFVCAVYNVIDYIEEALDSLVQQDYPIDRVQFILVDDGSTDDSGVFCDHFKKKHPSNTVVIHKENGGQASARLAGIPCVEGKYTCFFDPDDILSKNTLAKVFEFFEKHQDETDVVAIPIYFFGDLDGPHPLNGKFRQGSRVIDLKNEVNYPARQMSMASAFFSRDAITMIGSDPELVTSEDAKELVKILTKKMTLGVVDEGVRYMYRKRKTSTVGGAPSKPGWYLTYLEHFSQFAIDHCLNELGYIPKFIQNTILYDLQWKLRPQHIPHGLLTEDEETAYREKLFSFAKYFDDDIILDQSHLAIEHKLYLLYLKHGHGPEIRKDKKTKGFNVYYNNRLIYSLNRSVTFFNFIRIDRRTITVEGAIVTFLKTFDSPKIYIRFNGRLIPAQNVNYKDIIYSVDVPIAERKHFRATFKVPKEFKKLTVRVVAQYNNIQIPMERVIFGKYAPLTHKYMRSYYAKDDLLIHPAKNGFTIEKCTKKMIRKCEIAFCKDLLARKHKPALKAVAARCAYHLLKPLLPSNIWLVTDKADRADDNGEAFFRYLRSNKNKKLYRPIFAIGKDSPDYKRIKKIGPVVPYMSWRHKLIHLLAEHTISAYSHDEISSPFGQFSLYYGDLLQRNKIIFLQHGIIKDDLSPVLNKYQKNYALFVTSTVRERQAVQTDNYGYNKEQIIMTGLPRYDRLHNDPKKIITIMPTWLCSLFGSFNVKDSRWDLLPGFEESAYYLFYNELLKSKRLLDSADEMGYTIQFLPHPVLFPYVDRFTPDARVKVLGSDVRYNSILAESSLVTTDYSSVVFDFAYLEKPILYTHFEDNHYLEGYFDYRRDGFGEITTDLDSTVDKLIEYMKNDCRMKPEYLKRIKQFFAFNDKNNSQRVLNHILKLDGKIH